MPILKRFLLVAPALALLGAFLLGSPPAGAQNQRTVDLELSMVTFSPEIYANGAPAFRARVKNESDTPVVGVVVQFVAEDIARGGSIHFDEIRDSPISNFKNDGQLDYDTLVWSIPRIGGGDTAEAILEIDGERSMCGPDTSSPSIVRMRASIVESTPRDDPSRLGNNRASAHMQCNEHVGTNGRSIISGNVSYGVDAEPETDTFSVKVSNLGFSRNTGTIPTQYQLRLKVTPSPGLRYTATAPAGTTFNAATGIWNIGTLVTGSRSAGNKQMDIRVTQRAALAVPPEGQCLTVEIEHVIPVPRRHIDARHRLHGP